MRVVELATVLAGPFAGLLLRMLGAEVVKVEEAGRGDPLRTWGAAPGQQGEMFEYVNAGKSGVSLDFTSESGVATMSDLLTDADVLIVSGRPGMLERRGFPPERCHDLNPDLAIACLTGFGGEGPWGGRPAYDSVVQSVTGLLAAYGVTESLLTSTLPSIADMVGGLVLTQSALAGLVAAGRGQGGRVFETSLYEAVVAVMGPTYLRGQGVGGVERGPSLILQFTCADGAVVTIHLSNNERFWESLCGLVDPSLLHDPQFAGYADRVANVDRLRERLAPLFARQSADHWERALAGADVPVAQVVRLEEASAHPQAIALGLATPAGRFDRAAAPWRIDGHRPRVEGAAPRRAPGT